VAQEGQSDVDPALGNAPGNGLRRREFIHTSRMTELRCGEDETALLSSPRKAPSILPYDYTEKKENALSAKSVHAPLKFNPQKK
jgi:hypothetical protein